MEDRLFAANLRFDWALRLFEKERKKSNELEKELAQLKSENEMRKFVKVSIPTNASPLVTELFRLMNEEQIGVLDMSERTGINKNTFKDWRTRTVPKITDLEACFSVFGLKLKVVSNGN